MTELTERAPAKINLCLLVGPVRAQDGRHELVTVFEPLAARTTPSRSQARAATADEVVCPGVEGDEPRGARAARLPRGDRLGRARRCGS